MIEPYYQDDFVQLFHADCLEHPELWVGADILITDPPYGRGWRGTLNWKNQQGSGTGNSANARRIQNDTDTTARDTALQLWGDAPAIVFGDLLLAPPSGTKQVLIYEKAANAGIMAATSGYRRSVEAIYLVGKWPSGIGGRSAVLHVGGTVAGPTGAAALYGHPHAKPIALLDKLINNAGPGVIADPFAGSGTTLVAAKSLGRKSVGFELEEKYCETSAQRLAQDALPIWNLPSGGAA